MDVQFSWHHYGDSNRSLEGTKPVRTEQYILGVQKQSSLNPVIRHISLPFSVCVHSLVCTTTSHCSQCMLYVVESNPTEIYPLFSNGLEVDQIFMSTITLMLQFYREELLFNFFLFIFLTVNFKETSGAICICINLESPSFNLQTENTAEHKIKCKICPHTRIQFEQIWRIRFQMIN